jgi:hypothetical protein
MAHAIDRTTAKEGTPVDRPAPSLLRSWGKRMSEGKASVIPVFVGGSWSLAVPRGNKRVLSLSVPGGRKN